MKVSLISRKSSGDWRQAGRKLGGRKEAEQEPSKSRMENGSWAEAERKSNGAVWCWLRDSARLIRKSGVFYE